MDKRFKHISPNKIIDGQEVHEIMLNISNFWGNASQKYNEILSHTHYGGCYKKKTKKSIHKNKNHWSLCLLLVEI